MNPATAAYIIWFFTTLPSQPASGNQWFPMPTQFGDAASCQLAVHTIRQSDSFKVQCLPVGVDPLPGDK
jgi:hypothetical protein